MTQATVDSMTGTQSATWDPAPSRPRLALVGFNRLGHKALEALIRSETASLEAVVDPVVQAEPRVRSLLPEAQRFPHIEALPYEQLDGVVIASPASMRAHQAVHALENGLAVYGLQPLGRSRQETMHVVNAARKSDRLLAVDRPYHYLQATQAVRRYRDSLGRIYAVNAVYHVARSPDRNWFHDPSLSKEGCLSDLGVHLIDTVLWLLDYTSITAVSGSLLRHGFPVYHHSDKEDYATGLITLDRSINVSVSCSWGLPLGCDALIELSLFGTAGGLCLRNVNGSSNDFTAHRFTGTTREVLQEPPDNWGGRSLVAWARQLSKTNRYSSSVESAVEVASVLDAIYQP